MQYSVYSRRAATALVAVTLLALLLLPVSMTIGQDAPQTLTADKSARSTDAADIVTPPGYQIEPTVDGLNYPVDIAFGDDGTMYVAEGGDHTYGTTPDKAPPSRIVRVTPDGNTEVVYDTQVLLETIRNTPVGGDLPEGPIPPVTGVTYRDGKLYITHRTRISTYDLETGDFRTIIDKLPSWGFFHAGKVIFDQNGDMIFCQSTQGNAGPVDRHWMKVINIFNKPEAHEIPGEDVTLTGVNFPVQVEDPATPGVADKKMSGVYVPVGTTTEPGQTIKGQEICNGAFFRANPDGSNIRRIAWGFRSNFGYRFSSDGRLITTQNSGNPIPPREIHDDWESIYEVVEGEWYGWPDYYSSEPITLERFGPHPIEHEFALTEETRMRLLDGRRQPRPPLAKLDPHTAVQGMVFGRQDFGIPENEILVAEFGTIVPHTTDRMPGFKVSRVNLDNGGAEPFLFNRDGVPASVSGQGGFERPIQLEWGPDSSLYVIDFGVIRIDETGMHAEPGTGVIWQVSRSPEARMLTAVEPPQKSPNGHHNGQQNGHKDGSAQDDTTGQSDTTGGRH